MQSLEGLRILDLTRLAPGPYCTMLLADLGADVIRIEQFGPRSPERSGQPTVSELLNETRGFASPNSPFNALNRNKRSVALNLKTEEGRRVFYKLAETTDVVVEEFRPGTTKRLGVDYETLRQINSRIIYCAITGFGQNGSYRDRVGHDINYVGLAGALSLIGLRAGPLVVPHNFLADFAGGGMHAAIAILAALIAREKTAVGQYVDVSMFDGVVSLMSMILSYYFATGVAPGPQEHVDNGGFPFYNVYETKDGKYFTIGAIEPQFWSNLCRCLGREDLISVQWETGEKRTRIFTELQEIFKTRSRDEWEEVFAETDTCVGKVHLLDEVPSLGHVQDRELVVEVAHPGKGKVRQVGSPFKLSETPAKIRRHTPAFGEHTEEVVLEAGFSRAELQAFKDKGVCN